MKTCETSPTQSPPSITLSAVSDGSTKSNSPSYQCNACKCDLRQRKFVEVLSKNLCVPCFEMEFAKKCHACLKLIRLGQREVNYRDSHWHDSCFKCVLCAGNLVDCKFAFSHSELICTDCHEKEKSLKCFKCGGTFQSGHPMLEFGDKHWHESCFKCVRCCFMIGTSPFVFGGQWVSPMCSDCFEQNSSKACSKCHELIMGKGLSHEGQHWHIDCFCCVSCRRPLGGETTAAGEFVSKAEKLYCADCYINKWFFVCARCQLPIGKEQSNFLTFENENWHCKCFSCYRCNNSLVDQGFVVDKTRMFCPKCAKSVA